MPTCAVANCTNTDSNQNVKAFSFHRFPQKDKILQQVWLHKCKRKDRVNLLNGVVCSDHFSEDQFEIDKMNRLLNLKERRLLKTDAIPTLRLPLQEDIVTDTRRLDRAKRRQKFKDESKLSNMTEIGILQESSQNENEAPSTAKDNVPTVLIDESGSNSKYFGRIMTLEAQTDELLKRNRHLAVENHRLKSKIKNLKLRILTEKSYWMNRIPKQLSTIFSSAQVKHFSGQKRAKWSANDIAKSLSVVAISKTAYETIRKKWQLPLPSPSTIREWTKTYECKRGILSEILALMTEEANTIDIFQRLCVLNFDEMNLSSDVQLDISNDTIVGPHKNVQVAIANGLCKKWRQPIFYDFDQSMTQEILFDLICNLEQCGYPVCAIVSDLGGSNRGLWKQLNVNHLSPSFTNPVDSTRHVWVFADAPHMLKLVRNHLLDDGWDLGNGTVVTKAELQKMISLDNAEIKLCPQLTPRVLELTGAERMKVSPAAKIFSTHTATFSKFCFQSQPSISRFFQLVDDYFDIFNSRTPTDFDKPIRGAYGLCLQLQNQHLEEVSTLISTMRTIFYSKKSKQLIPRKALLPCQKGIIGSIVALKNLLIEVRAKFGVSYIITRRLTQDPLENLFSIIRALGRTHDNPTPPAFRHRLKLVLLGSKVATPTNTNTIPDSDIDGHYYISTKLFEYVKELKPDKTEDDDIFQVFQAGDETILRQDLENPNDELYSAALKYIAGYLAFVVMKKYNMNCGTYTKDLCTRIVDQENLEHCWIIELSRGGLIEPSEEFVLIIEKCDEIFRKFFCTENLIGVSGISNKVIRFITFKQPSFNRLIVKEFVKTRIRIRIKYLNSHKELCGRRSSKRASSSRPSRNVKKAKQFKLQ